MNRMTAILAALLCAAGCSAGTAGHSVAVGVENSEYVYVRYAFRGRWSAKALNSVFIEGLDEQYFRLELGYADSIGPVRWEITPRAGFNYGRRFAHCGVSLGAEYRISRLTAGAAVMPFYDSGLRYTTCYDFRARVRIWKGISAGAVFSNIPEYRVADRRVKAHVRFETGGLTVVPEFSFPVKSSSRPRFLLSFCYAFRF